MPPFCGTRECGTRLCTDISRMNIYLHQINVMFTPNIANFTALVLEKIFNQIETRREAETYRIDRQRDVEPWYSNCREVSSVITDYCRLSALPAFCVFT